MSDGPMLNAYPDSMGGTLHEIIEFLKKSECKNAFSSFYILPSIFHTDLDRGFSVIDYSLNRRLAAKEDIEALQDLGIDLKLDFILNHASVLSRQFQDILEKGEKSKYKDFFIDWNKFWDGYGTMTKEGYIQPDEIYIKDMFFRKPGLPILVVRFPDGKNVPYWNTFYQEVRYPKLDAWDIRKVSDLQYEEAVELSESVNDQISKGVKAAELSLGKYESCRGSIVELLESQRKYLGQMDLNIKSPLVWEFYEDTLEKLSQYGAKIVRLDAFAYAPKEPGLKNFLNEPGTWELLEKVNQLAKQYNLELLPEIHAVYQDKYYEIISDKGYLTYDFFLPGLMIYALEHKDGSVLVKWAKELMEKNIRVVNMLGCHDGIPVLDLKGFLSEEDIQEIIDTLVTRGGVVKNLHGQKNMYYQVNCTYYSALGEDDRKLLFARALQMFMPGKPQVWYLDLFAGKNDYEAVKNAGSAGHKEINRTNLTTEQIQDALQKEVVTKQLELLQLRNTHPAFGFDASLNVTQKEHKVTFTWTKKQHEISLTADFADYSYEIKQKRK